MAQTDVTVDGVDWWVSTTWLGLDHQWEKTNAPLIFETMIFLKDHFKHMEETTKECELRGIERWSKEGIRISEEKRAWHKPYEDSEFYEWQCRWATEERAQRGHQATVAWMLREGPEPEGDYDLPRDQWEKEVLDAQEHRPTGG